MLTLGEWLRFTPSISVSTFSRYHCHPELSTTGSSEDFNFALFLGALQSPLWLHFNSSSCLYLSSSLLFLAFVPESWNILLVRIPKITFLLSFTASSLRTCSQGFKTFSAQGALLLRGCACEDLARLSARRQFVDGPWLPQLPTWQPSMYSACIIYGMFRLLAPTNPILSI